MSSSFKYNERDADLFKDVVFIVEANSNESHMLWEKYHYNTDPVIKSWEQEMTGRSIQIGKLDKRPVIVSLFYAKLNGKRVAFYHGCSQVVDHKMIEDWLLHFTSHIKWDNGYRWAHCDAMNFHLCIDAIGVS